MMNSKYINALTIYLFVLCAAISLFIIVYVNSDKALIARILFAPFALDISRGVGDTAALLFRGITTLSFIIMIAVMALRIRASDKSTKVLLSVAGLAATTIHYGLVCIGYLSTKLH